MQNIEVHPITISKDHIIIYKTIPYCYFRQHQKPAAERVDNTILYNRMQHKKVYSAQDQYEYIALKKCKTRCKVFKLTKLQETYSGKVQRRFFQLSFPSTIITQK
jgi:hypothetical protein